MDCTTTTEEKDTMSNRINAHGMNAKWYVPLNGDVIREDEDLVMEQAYLVLMEDGIYVVDNRAWATPVMNLTDEYTGVTTPPNEDDWENAISAALCYLDYMKQGNTSI